MTSQSFPRVALLRAEIILLLVLPGGLLCAQGPAPDAPQQTVAVATPMLANSALPAPIPTSPLVAAPSSTPVPQPPRRFLDKWNLGLFTGAAALDATDFAITRSNLQSNGKELNPVVRMFGRSTAGLAMNFGGEAVGTVGLSYFFHRTRHYMLERAVSLVNIGVSTGAVTYSSTHR